jgi:hypothetical protein
MNKYTLEELAQHHANTGSIVSRYVRESDYNALAAQVEVLRREFQDARRTLQVIASCGGDSTDAEIVDVVLDEARRWVSRYDDSVLKLKPAACLAQVRADAGRAGFVAGYHKMHIEFVGSVAPTGSAEQLADQYAERIRQEVV